MKNFVSKSVDLLLALVVARAAKPLLGLFAVFTFLGAGTVAHAGWTTPPPGTMTVNTSVTVGVTGNGWPSAFTYIVLWRQNPSSTWAATVLTTLPAQVNSVSTSGTFTPNALGTWTLKVTAQSTPPSLPTGPVGTTLAGPTQVTVSAAQGDNVIAFNSLPDRTYGDAPFDPGATASSGLSVSYSVTGPASVSGNIVSINGAGGVTVTASQAGNANYVAAVPVSQSFTVNKASQSIDFSCPTNIGAGLSFTMNATASTGMAITYSATGPASVSGSTLNITGPGPVTVTATQAGGSNYYAASKSCNINSISMGWNTMPPYPATSDPSSYYPISCTTSVFNQNYTNVYLYAQNPQGTWSMVGQGNAVASSGTVNATGAVKLDIIGYWTLRAVYNTPDPSATRATGVSDLTVLVKANQTITFPDIPTHTYGDASFDLGAVAMRADQPGMPSGLGVSYTVDGPAVLESSPTGVRLRVTGAGSGTVTASQGGSDYYFYNAAPSVAKPFSVNKGTPTLSWAPAPITYGTPLSEAQLNAVAIFSGVPLSGGSFVYSPTLGTTLPAGIQTLSVTFYPSASDANSLNPVSGSTTLVVNKATPTISWATPAAITYGAALSGTQLNASASVPGSFSYSPSAGTVVGAGNQTLSVTFTPSDTANYNTATNSVSLVVNKATPTISWTTPGAITYGTPLSGTQLNASASVPGSFSYSPSAGTVVSAGSQTLSVTFTPSDSANYTTATASVNLSVNKATPAITWATPEAISYGMALSGTQLDASASVPGSFSYSPGAGTVLASGSQMLSVAFTPSDSANYSTASASVSLSVNKATPTISWPTPATITYGTPLSGTQLNASANVPGGFNYSPSAGAVLGAGTQALSTTFTPSDTANYTTATASVSLVVTKATPTIFWTTPGAITYGTPLSGTQLSATASVPGSFSYSPGAGAILGAGNQTLSVTFTPSDTANYNPAIAGVNLLVNKLPPTITWPNPSPVTYGTVLSGLQLNATSNVPGIFSYSPATGTLLSAGTQPLQVTFTPADTSNYTNATAGVSLAVNKATPTIIWATPAAIAYGTALSGTQLNASASVPGSFSYSPGAGTVLGIGNHTLSVSFTPSDTTNYTNASASVPLSVNQASTTITWATPAAITYGTALSGTQLNATASVPGSFSYSPVAGTVLSSGNQTLSATFTPSDTTNYATATANVNLLVNKAAPTITWATPPPITYGTALSGTQLNAAADVPGSFSYSPVAGTVLNSGSQMLSTTFTPSDTANYNVATASVPLTVNKANVIVITWATPAAITYGTSLSGTQLNATANIPIQSWVYTPPPGTILNGGPNQTLSVIAIPQDQVNYAAASASVQITVNKATQTIIFPDDLQSHFAGDSFAIGATCTSGLAVTSYSATGPVSISNGILTINGAGPITLTAYQAGDQNYESTSKQISWEAGKVSQTITFADPGLLQVGASCILNASATSGLPVTFTLMSGPATLSGSTLTLTGADPVNVKASQPGNDVYAPAAEVSRIITADSNQTGLHWRISPPVMVTEGSYTISASDKETNTQAVSVTLYKDGVRLTTPGSGGLGNPTGPITYTATYTEQASGDHIFAYKAESTVVASGGAMTTTTLNATVQVDTDGPSTPPAPVVSDALGFSLTTSWPASNDLAGVAGYQIECRDASQAAVVTTVDTSRLSAVVSGLIPKTTYNLRVRAQDRVGHWSEWGPYLAISSGLDPLADEDGDGLPNGYERMYGLNPYDPADANGDLNGDGWSNLAEYKSGLNPLDYNPGYSTDINDTVTLVTPPTGSFSVDNKGEANYTVPLRIAAGRGSMGPSLAVSYNSGGGNGVLGVGCALSTGFPQSITRGRSILARDGVVRGVEFSQNDKFYLDGKRLIVVGDIAYGLPGSTYRTEVDSFQTITTSGSGTNIDSFVVTDKSGTKMYFGKYSTSSDAYQQGGGETEDKAQAYALKRVEDALGNYCDFIYDKNDPNDGEYVLSKIQYTGNTQQSILPGREIVFTYTTSRPDKSITFEAKRSFAHSKRLALAEAKDGVNGTVISRYVFGYKQAAFAGRSRLTMITPYLRDGNGLTLGTRVAFNWTDATQTQTLAIQASPTDTVKSLPTDPNAWGDQYRVNREGIGDFDGDGNEEMVYADSAEGIKVYRNIGNSMVPEVWLSPGALSVGSMHNGPGSIFAIDLNGDGRKDLLIADRDFVNIYAVVSTGTSFKGLDGGVYPTLVFNTDDVLMNISPPGSTPVATHEFRSRDSGAAGGRFVIGDFNGDGREDILVHGYDGYFYLFKSTGNGFEPVQKSATQLASPCYYAPAMWNVSNPAGYIPSPAVMKNYSITPFVCDLNGDGISDYAWIERDDSGNGPITYGTAQYGNLRQMKAVVSLPGGGFSHSVAVGPPQIASSIPGPTGHTMSRESALFAVFPGDYNGDGKTDFLFCLDGSQVGHSSSRWLMLFSSGNDVDGPPKFSGVWDPMPSAITIQGQVTPTMYSIIDTDTWSANSFGNPPLLSWGTPALDLYNSVLYSTGENMAAMDVNHDGLTDFVWYAYNGDSSTDGWYVLYSDGKGGFLTDKPCRLEGIWANFVPKPASGNLRWYAEPNYHFSLAGDMNGDGLQDLVVRRSDTGHPKGMVGLSHAQGFYGDLVVGVTDGFSISGLVKGANAKTEIFYKPGKDTSIYTPGVAVQYPIREMASSSPVVSDIYKEAGGAFGSFGTPAYDATGKLIRDVSHFSYQYSGNRLDLSGRGTLGFHSFVTLDRQTNLFKYQFLTQSFPMTGLTAREQTYRYWTSGSAAKFRLISTHDNTVVFDEVVKSATDGTAWGTVYPFISKAIESRYEDSTAAHFTLSTASACSQSENLFPKARPNDAHITITAESLFDEQEAVQTTIPGSYNASDRTTDWSLEGDNAVNGSTDYTAFHSLPFSRKITYGNLRQLHTDFGDGFTETVTTAYKAPDGLLTGLVDTVQTKVTSPSFGEESAPTKSYTYRPGTPLVVTETVDAADSPDVNLDTTTTYTRDEDRPWRVKEVSISGDSIGSYTVSKNTAFNDTFDLPTETKDTYDHTTTTVYHSIFGLPTSVTDANGAEVATEYDALGRAIKVTDMLKGYVTSISFAWDSSQTVSATTAGVIGLDLPSAYAVTTVTKSADDTVTLKSATTAYYDRLGRVIRAIKDGFNNQQAVTDTIYNTLGQIVAVSNPYPSGGTTYWTTTTYDPMGRVVTVSAPNGTVTTNTYNGRVTQVAVKATDCDEQKNTTYVDAKGRTIKVWNADNEPSALDPVTGSATTASIEYKLDGFGRMRETILKDQTQTIKATYDALGRQLTLDDPDKGLWRYLNNALGQVVYQKDAKLNETSSYFDRLGRPLTRITTEPLSGPIETANWYYYDTAANVTTYPHLVAKGDKGWIGSPQRDEAITTGAPGYGASAATNVYYYDAKGRPSIALSQIDDKWFYTTTDYDDYSRVHQIQHFWRPPGYENLGETSGTWSDYGLINTYDTQSYLLKITDTRSNVWWEADPSTGYDYLDRPVKFQKGSGYWTTRTYRPEDGLLTDITTGGGAVQALSFGYDGLGNLTSRGDDLRHTAETFGYDNVNRLTSSTKTGAISYYDNGNIKNKRSVAGETTSDYAYDSSKPHAVATAFGYSMQYDANGNLLTRTGKGHTWTTQWAGFDKPRWLAQDSKGNEFVYNANRSRVLELDFDQMSSGTAPEPTHYTRKRLYAAGPAVELEYKNGATDGATWTLDKVRCYITSPDGSTGAMEYTPATTAWDGKVYHNDHLGSVDSITPLGNIASTYSTDSDGRPGRYSYDAWGQRRNADTWTGAPVDTAHGGRDDLTPKGFTGHEMLDTLGLVHMNGRIYDPLLGRFLSADLVVQFPGSLQSYNRYSYVENNPLTRMDPTGWYSVLGLEFINGGGVKGFFKDSWGYACSASSGAGHGAAAYANGFNRGAVGAIKGTGQFLADPVGTFKATGEGLGTLAGRTVYDTKAVVAETLADLSDPTKIGESFGNAVTTTAIGLGTAKGLNAMSEVPSPSTTTSNVVTQEANALGGAGAGEARIGTAAPEAKLATTVPDAPSTLQNTSMRAGQLAEAPALDAIGSTGKVTFTPTAEQINSAAFKVVVGDAKYTASGVPVSTIFDGSTATGLAEIKSGSSVLNSTYQLRLQTYASLTSEQPFTIYTSRPVNTAFGDWLNRWGVSVKPLP